MATNADTNEARRAALRAKYYPETLIDDFSRLDTSIAFYTRVNALLSHEMTVLDLGAGRGQWYDDSASLTRKSLRDLRGRVKHVVGLDLDPIVARNPSLDETHTIATDAPFPLADASVDLVISDVTFEHIDNPQHVAAEIHRVLRPGGWVCARTPNKWGYIGLAARITPNRLHTKLLHRLQPERRDIDVFPTRYRLNTRRSIQRYFQIESYDNIIYTLPCEPRYAGASKLLWSVFQMAQRVSPRAYDPMLLIFLRKRE